MPSQRKAIIVGGSVGGLFAALALRRIGWDVQVIERTAEPLSARGAGIATHPQLLAALQRVGVATGPNFGVAVTRRVMLARDGQTIAELAFPQIMTSWDRLHRGLMQACGALSYRPGSVLAGVDTRGLQPVARLGSGERLAADLIVGADGFRSTLRSLLMPDLMPDYAGYVGWRGLIDEAALRPELRRDIFPLFALALPPGEQILGYPVAGLDDVLTPGHRRYNFVWYRPATGAVFDAMMTDATGRRHDISIPPPMIRPAVIDALRADARRVLPPALAEIVVATQGPYFQPIYDLAVPRMVDGSCVLIGDAAFVVRPHVGAGVTKAAEDALRLADCLAANDDLDVALRCFESTRLDAGRAIAERGKRLGRAIHARQPDIAVMLAESASLRWLVSGTDG